MQPCNARESKASINADGAKRQTLNNITVLSVSGRNEDEMENFVIENIIDVIDEWVYNLASYCDIDSRDVAVLKAEIRKVAEKNGEE